MVKRHVGMRGVALLAFLAGSALLQAQPTINGPNASPPGLQSSVEAATSCASVPTNGAAITAGTPTPSDAICLYINGTFDVVAGGAAVTNTVTWLPSGLNQTVTTLTTLSVSATQIVVFVPGGLYANAGTASIQVTQEINPFVAPPTFTSSNIATFTINPVLAQEPTIGPGYVGVPFSQPFFTGGTGPFTVAFPPASQPPGLNSTAVTGNPLAGTPTLAGNFGIDPTITDSWNNTLTPGDFGIQIFNPLVINTGSLPNGVLNAPYASNTALAASGGATPYIWSASGLPPGVTLNPGGTFSGSPTQSGPFTALVTVSDNSSQTVSVSFSFTIFATLTITTNTLPNGVINTAYPSTTLVGSGGSAGHYQWTASGLPSGMSLSLAGVLSGTPLASGNFVASITLTDGIQTTPATLLPFTIFATLTITTNSLPNGVINITYPIRTLLGAGGSAGNYQWTATGLPNGMSLSLAGVLSGTPTASGNFTASITLTDGIQTTQPALLPFTIFATLTVTTNTLPNGVINVAYPSTTILASGGSAGNYQWTATGLPNGMSLSLAGVLSGTPTQSGPFSASITVTDGIQTTLAASIPFTIFATLTITTNSLPNGRISTAYPSTTLAASGGFPAQNSWSATGLPMGLNLNQSTGALSGTPTQSGIFNVSVTLTNSDPAQTATVPLSLNIVPTLVITTTALPAGATGFPYGAVLSGSGGALPYVWSATGLPPGLVLNAASGAFSGSPTQTGSFAVGVTLTDNAQVDTGGQTVRAGFNINISSPTPPPVQITTSSLPNGTVGVFYASLIGVTGGNGGPYTFIVNGASFASGVSTGGSGLPPGMQLANNGQLQGTPTAAGSFSFGVTATDSAGNSGTGTVSITITGAPLVITTGALGSVQAGSSISIVFAATGGVPPLSFSLGGTPPPGTSFASNGTLSGTVATAGSYSFTVTVTDSVKTTASKGFTLVVTAPSLTITTTSLPAGQVGAAYAGQFAAVGGTPPYTWSGTAGGGLSISSSGAVSGTPTATGTYAVSVTVTDSLGVKATGSFSVTVTASTLAVATSSLPNGALTSAYAANLSATGGTPPYTWSASGLPPGITASSSGALSGTPTSPGTFTVSVTVKDSAGVSASANLSLTILPAPLEITGTSIAPATLGTSFSVAFGATGGTPPYTWTATGLPAGVTMSSTGTLSGTPTAVGISPITVSVTDSSGLKASETFSISVALPVAPTLTLTGLPATASPATQSTGSVTLSTTYPVAVTVTLTLTFTPLSGADDPNIQFSTGGRTATLTVPAGATVSTTGVGVQTGTVAGTITITSQLTAAGQNITPTPAPTKTIVIGAAAPSITSVAAATNSTGFTVTIDGFDPTRAVTQVVFTFAAAAGSNLQTTSVTVAATALFSSWYQSSAATAYGSQFSFTIPFTVTGNVSSITSVTVTLVNPTGTSTASTTSL